MNNPGTMRTAISENKAKTAMEFVIKELWRTFEKKLEEKDGRIYNLELRVEELSREIDDFKNQTQTSIDYLDRSKKDKS